MLAAFATSLKRLNWRHPFEHFLEQEMRFSLPAVA
jgi:hypothetical protein